MKYICPDYYPEFKCIADRCKHNCCIGWEIDVDDEMREKYDQVTGAMGYRLRNSILRTKDGAQFMLDKKGRCPFLNKQGLCDIITELGENYLCQICNDHPRFRTFYSDREEIGLGLCCEEAARLILTREEPMRLIEMHSDGVEEDAQEQELLFYKQREEILAIAQDRTISVAQRLRKIEAFCNVDIGGWPSGEIATIFAVLECMDISWQIRLLRISKRPDYDVVIPDDQQIFYEQLLCYLIYRHMPLCLEEWEMDEWAMLISMFMHVVVLLTEDKSADMLDMARLFSAEVEYSDENLDFLFSMILKMLKK